MMPMEVIKRPVSKGEVLLTSRPFAYVLQSSLQDLHCDHCLRARQKLKRCSACEVVKYCNKECQQESWAIHKRECRNLKGLKPRILPNTARLMARIVIRLKYGGDAVKEKITENWRRGFMDLMTHRKEIKEDSKRQEHFASLAIVLRSFFGEDNVPSTEELFGIFCRICINSFSITDDDHNTVGTGVYLAGSIVDHSCQPNACASFIGSELTIRALTDMPRPEWSDVRISYIDTLNTDEQRRDELSHNYYFLCDCSLCTTGSRNRIFSSINCGNESCNAPVLVPDDATDSAIDPCPECGFNSFSPETYEKYFEVISFTKGNFENMKQFNYLDMCKVILDYQGTLLHKKNLWRVKVLDAAFEAAISMSSWEDARMYGLENMEGLRFFYGENHPLFGLFLLKLGKIELLLFRIFDALPHLEEAESIIRITHGSEHPLYFYKLLPVLKQARQETMALKGTRNAQMIMHENDSPAR